MKGKVCPILGVEAKLKEEWANWLGSLAEWEWFVTITLKNPQGIPTYTKPGIGCANRAWGEFVARARPALIPLKWVRMFETQHWRGVPHIHALVAGVDPTVRRMDLVDTFYEKFGITRVLQYDSKLGARYYVCKYVTKELGDIQFSESLNFRR